MRNWEKFERSASLGSVLERETVFGGNLLEKKVFTVFLHLKSKECTFNIRLGLSSIIYTPNRFELFVELLTSKF